MLVHLEILPALDLDIRNIETVVEMVFMIKYTTNTRDGELRRQRREEWGGRRRKTWWLWQEWWTCPLAEGLSSNRISQASETDTVSIFPINSSAYSSRRKSTVAMSRQEEFEKSKEAVGKNNDLGRQLGLLILPLADSAHSARDYPTPRPGSAHRYLGDTEEGSPPLSWT